MSEQRTEGQEPERGQGSVTLSKEQIELIGAILEPRFEKVEARFEKVEARFDQVIAEMRLMTNEAVKEMRGALDTAVKDLRAEGKEMRAEMKDDLRQQSKHFSWVIGILVVIGLAAAGGMAVHTHSPAVPVVQGAAVAPATPVAQVAPVAPAEPPDQSQP